MSAGYFVVDRFVKVDRTNATPIGMVIRLHMAAGVTAFRVLQPATIAAGMIVLSITGLLLWTWLHTLRPKAVLATVGASPPGVYLMWSM